MQRCLLPISRVAGCQLLIDYNAEIHQAAPSGSHALLSPPIAASNSLSLCSADACFPAGSLGSPPGAAAPLLLFSSSTSFRSANECLNPAFSASASPTAIPPFPAEIEFDRGVDVPETEAETEASTPGRRELDAVGLVSSPHGLAFQLGSLPLVPAPGTAKPAVDRGPGWIGMSP